MMPKQWRRKTSGSLLDAVILSSADIARTLGGDAIIRQEAVISVVDGRAPLGTEDKVYIYIDKYPVVDEFEATWKVKVVEGASDLGDLVRQSMLSRLPRLQASGRDYTLTEFRSAETEIRPEPQESAKGAAETSFSLREDFQRLEQDIKDRMLLINSGRPGKDGADGVDGLPGKDGLDGRDGKDLDSTEVELFDLKDVNQGIGLKKGQVLTWDGSDWTNLYVPQLQAIIKGGGGGDGEGVIISDTAPSTRDDGKPLEEGDQWWDPTTGVMYVWYVDADSGQWVQSSGGEGGGGATTVTDLLDTDTSGVVDGEILVYRSATGNWTAEPAPATGLQSGDNVSELVNDAGYITVAEVPEAPVTSVAGKTGTVVLDSDDVGLGNVDNTSDLDKPVSTATQAALDAKADLVNGVIPTSQIPAIAITEFLGPVASEAEMLLLVGQPGDWCLRTDVAIGYVIIGPDPSLASNWEAFTVPGSAVTSVNGQVGTVVLGPSDVGAATAAQGALTDTAIQPGDNVSDLTNDAGYITLADVPGGEGTIDGGNFDVGSAASSSVATLDGGIFV